MDASQVVITALLAVFSGAGASLIAGLVARPKTKAEAGNLNAAASVAVSADARAWAQQFAERADAAERRADAAEKRADDAEEKANHADSHADKLEKRADELQTAIIQCYGYVRKLHDQIRAHDETPIPAPVKLEALWRTSSGGNDRSDR